MSMVLNSSSDTGPKILLLSAYDAGSHQQWRQTLCEMFAHCQWTCLTLPARHFAWRVRGNSLSWAFNHRQELTDNYDLVIATSLTDLASLRGFVPALAGIPTLVYFHENQFAYPLSADQHGSVEPAMVNLYSALCADHVAFNSEWNRQSFLLGAQRLLTKLPDHVPPGLIEQIRERSSVVPVPLPDQLFTPRQQAQRPHAGPLQIVWNHRHEYDKGPDLLLLIVRVLIQGTQPFRLHVLGQRFRRRPEAFNEVDAVLQEYYQHNGIEPGVNQYITSRADYQQLLMQSDIVLSTALHDFQGLSMLEAVALGCFAVAPDALAYPEYLPADGLFAVSGLDLSTQARGAAQCIQRHALSLLNTGTKALNHQDYAARLSAGVLRSSWQQTLHALLKS
jgi:glycosyltransferase involved in cell wall biosynthesis